MPNPEKPFFAEAVLSSAERSQEAFGNSRAWKFITRQVTGSRWPQYQQLTWFSRDITTDIDETVKVPGNQFAPLLPRHHVDLIVMATPAEQMADASSEPYYEAVAYWGGKKYHVGTGEDARLFGRVSETERGIAMRYGRGLMQATMGKFYPEDRRFVSVEQLRDVERDLYIGHLAARYPNVPLV